MIPKLATNTMRVLFVGASTLLVTAPALFAQDASPIQKTALQRWVLDGGYTMIFIFAAIVGFIALTCFNFFTLTKKRFCPDELKVVLLDHMRNCRVRSAIEVASTDASFLGRMVAYAFPNINATQLETLGRDQVEDAIADFTTNETRKLFAPINYISMCAQVSPMLGLLGTVIGMVEAFGILAITGSADPSQLAGSISVALLTTLWGLLNAIPCISMFFFFKGRLQNLVAECHHTAEDMLNASLQTIHADSYLAQIPEGIAV